MNSQPHEDTLVIRRFRRVLDKLDLDDYNEFFEGLVESINEMTETLKVIKGGNDWFSK